MAIATAPHTADPPHPPAERESTPGDRVFEGLDRRYRPFLQSLARAMSFSAEDAEDIVQETLLDLFLSGTASEAHIGLAPLVSALAATGERWRRGARSRYRLRVALARDALTDGSAEKRGRRLPRDESEVRLASVGDRRPPRRLRREQAAGAPSSGRRNAA